MFTVETTTHGVLLGAVSINEFIRTVAASGSHFFDPHTMSWFGTRSNSLTVVRGVVMVGKDGKAPPSIPPYWARVFTYAPDKLCMGEYLNETREYVEDYEPARYWTRYQAIKAAKAFADKVLTDPANN